jgi:hypothetical protein
MDQRPEQPPEGRLIAAAAEHMKLSIRQAAKRAGISYGRWRQIVQGYQNVSPGVFSSVRGPAPTVAKMAAVAGVTPEQMETEGQRPDVAKVMRAARPVAAPVLIREAREDATVIGLAPRMAEAVMEYLPEIAGLASAAAEIEEMPVPPGEAVFGPGPEADRWDKLVQLGWDMSPGKGFTLAQLVRAAAVARVKDAERREDYGGGEAAVRLISHLKRTIIASR